MFEPVRRVSVSASDIATATVLAVVSLTNPSTELNARAGITNGALCLATQNVAGINQWTLYAFDAASSGSVNVPYVVDASGSGQWIAVAGKYLNGPGNMANSLIVGAVNSSAICGAINSSSAVNLAGTNPVLAGTTQQGVQVDFRGNSSATAAVRAAFYRAGTDGSGFTAATAAAAVFGTIIIGSGDTVTRGTSLQVTPITGCTNNYGITHSTGTPGTGNYFLYDDAGYASKVSGVWTYTDTTDATAIGTASVVLGGGLGIAKALFLGGDANFSSTPFTIKANTTDGSDTFGLRLASGGAFSSTRGACIDLWGNESASHGLLRIIAGDDSGNGTVVLNTAGTSWFTLDRAGLITHTGAVAISGTTKIGTAAVAGLPTAGTAGRLYFATNGRKNGEGAGAGTGVLAFDDGTAWRACDTGATVAA